MLETPNAFFILNCLPLVREQNLFRCNLIILASTTVVMIVFLYLLYLATQDSDARNDDPEFTGDNEEATAKRSCKLSCLLEGSLCLYQKEEHSYNLTRSFLPTLLHLDSALYEGHELIALSAGVCICVFDLRGITQLVLKHASARWRWS